MRVALIAWAIVASLREAVGLQVSGPQAVNLWKLAETQRHNGGVLVQKTNAYSFNLNYSEFSEFPEQWFAQPIDHFSNNSPTFNQRYWVNVRHYTPGSKTPVFVLDGGETNGEDRLPFLDTGIIEILCKATGGVGVVLEHRYYGSSIPVQNFTTDSLRWLNNEQALEDSARFMANVKFDGINEDLTAPNTRWIYYGGSYAGARSAHMKVLYPDLVYGAIASSGVTDAKIELWEYNDVIRRYADPKCSEHLVNLATGIDALLHVAPLNRIVKGLFGLGGLKHDYDFVATIESTIGSWQNKNWDPAIDDTTFDRFCAALDNPVSNISTVIDTNLISEDDVKQLVANPKVDLTIFNYAKWVRENVVSGCPKDQTVEQCFGTYNDTKYQGTSLNETWKLWVYQYCTQWGYFFVAPPDKELPRIVSRLHTLETESRICHQAFPPGEYNAVPALPNVSAVNVLGNFDIAANRLAIIDGEMDPWRPVTPHSSYYAKNRTDTILQPFKLIPGGVHHYDEYGIADEPKQIQQIHQEMIDFVREWLS